MDVQKRSLTLYSEGTRIAAECYIPAHLPPAKGFPGILLCHGWSGVQSQLASFAGDLARSGFAVMTFDYRGWGESDGRIIPTRDAPPLLKAGEQTLRVRVLREVIDPVDQVADVNNCLHALASETGVDPARLGIWGTSFGGGHAVFVAGNNSLIKAVVAQVGGFGLAPEFHNHARARAVEKVRGHMDPAVPQGGLDGLPNLSGTPDVARMLLHSPLAAAANIRVPSLIIEVDQEELVNRLDHGLAVYELVRPNAISEYRLLPGKHYDIYDRHREEAKNLALAWFKAHL
jgi:dienelactone hydrolase